MYADKYESNHTGDGKTDGRTRTEVRTGKIYKFVGSNAVTRGVMESWTFMTRVIDFTFLQALAHSISLVLANIFIF